MGTTTDPSPGGRLSRALRFSVRTRITVAIAVLSALALAGAGGLLYAVGSARINQDVPREVDQEMAEFVGFQRDGIDPETGGPPRTVERLVQVFLQRNVAGANELLVGFWDDDWQLRSASPRGDLAEEPAFLDSVRRQVGGRGAETIDSPRYGEVYVAVQPVQDRVHDDGAFVVAYFTSADRRQLEDLIRIYAVAAVLAVLGIAGFAAWLSGRLLSPLRTLRDTAHELSESDLSRRIPERGNDDITDLTRTVNAMIGRLEQAFATQREFLDDAGHELRTPLTILRGHLELLDPDDPQEVAHTRDLVLDEVDRMSGLVDDLITLAKADRPDFFRFAAVDVDALVRTVTDKCRGLGDRAWTVDALPGGEAVLDEQRITQALLQLAQNAVKHTHAGDEIGLGAALAEAGRTLRLWVRDTGPGVDDAHKEAIFARFTRAEVAPDDDGFGLGLSLVSAIVAGHGGSVTVHDAETRPGLPRGARFVIEIPVRRKETSWPAS